MLLKKTQITFLLHLSANFIRPTEALRRSCTLKSAITYVSTEMLMFPKLENLL